FEYVYFPPEPGTAEFLIYSYGADGEEGGDGENADISNQTIVETAETGL
ncbi:MAG: type II secretion system protein GspG, partial [Sedimentisphaerales bacterium]|nr:type II secretion system protein GspG [Sedimentisphaerales bacterium]